MPSCLYDETAPIMATQTWMQCSRRIYSKLANQVCLGPWFMEKKGGNSIDVSFVAMPLKKGTICLMPLHSYFGKNERTSLKILYFSGCKFLSFYRQSRRTRQHAPSLI